MKKLSRQQSIIVEALRSKDWVCGSVWLDGIKDDRARITALNRGYMKERSWKIVGKPCDGRCGKSHSSNLYMRRAERINAPEAIPEPVEGYLEGKELQDTLRQMDIFFKTI